MKFRISWTSLLVAAAVLDFLDCFFNLFVAGSTYLQYDHKIEAGLIFLSNINGFFFGLIVHNIFSIVVCNRPIATTFFDFHSHLFGLFDNLYKLVFKPSEREEMYEVCHTMLTEQMLIQLESTVTHIAHFLFRSLPVACIHHFKYVDRDSTGHDANLLYLGTITNLAFGAIVVLLFTRCIIHCAVRHLLFNVRFEISSLTNYSINETKIASRLIREPDLEEHEKAKKALRKLQRVTRICLSPFIDLVWVVLFVSDYESRIVSLALFSSHHKTYAGGIFVIVCLELTAGLLHLSYGFASETRDKYTDMFLNYFSGSTSFLLMNIVRILFLIIFSPIILPIFGIYKFYNDFGNKHGISNRIQQMQYCVVIFFPITFPLYLMVCIISLSFAFLVVVCTNMVPIICYAFSFHATSAYLNSKYAWKKESSYGFFQQSLLWVIGVLILRAFQNLIFILISVDVTVDETALYAFIYTSALQLLAVAMLLYWGFHSMDHVFKRFVDVLQDSTECLEEDSNEEEDIFVFTLSRKKSIAHLEKVYPNDAESQYFASSDLKKTTIQHLEKDPGSPYCASDLK